MFLYSDLNSSRGNFCWSLFSHSSNPFIDIVPVLNQNILVHSLCHSRVRIWSYIVDPFFCAKTESAANPLPRSVIVPSLSDFASGLPEWVQCPVRAIKFLRKAARSASYIPSRLFVSPRNPERAMSRNAISFSLRQLITGGGAVSSLRPPGAHDIRGFATSLSYYSNLSFPPYANCYVEVNLCLHF